MIYIYIYSYYIYSYYIYIVVIYIYNIYDIIKDILVVVAWAPSGFPTLEDMARIPRWAQAPLHLSW